MGEKHGRVPNLFCFLLFWLVSGCFRPGTEPTICDLQGSENQSRYVDQVITVEGQVRADFEESPQRGFSLECDSDESSGGLPCGIWVQKEDKGDLVAAGDRIRASLRIEERNGETMGWLVDGSLQILEVSQKLSGPVFVTFSKSLVGGWERWEGCVLQFPVFWVLEGKQQTYILYSGKNLPVSGSDSKLDQSPDAVRVRSDSQSAVLSDAFPGDLLINVQGLLREDREGYYLQLVNEEGIETIRLGDRELSPVSYSGAQLENGTPIPRETGSSPSPTLTPTVTATPFPVRLLISEFMADPSAREPDGEWIEIYNRDDFAVPLADVKIGDAGTSGGKEGMLRFPPGYLIKSRDVIVVANKASVFKKEYGRLPDFELVSSLEQVPDLLPYDLWGGSKVQLSNSGDEVLLLDGWDQILDAVAYGNSDFSTAGKPVPAADEGCSLERYPPDQDRNQPGDFRERSRVSPGRLDRSPPTPRPSLTPTRTLSPTPSPSPTGTPAPPTATPPVLQLLLSEVMVNPVNAEPEGEWIELFNPSEDPMDLSYAKLGDAQAADSREGMLAFPNGAVLEPGEYGLVANHAETFRERWGFLPDYEIQSSKSEIPDLEPYQEWCGSNLQLSNQGDEILLLDGWDGILDQVAFGSSQFAGYQPPVSAPGEGFSLCRAAVGLEPGIWLICDSPSPGNLNSLPPTASATRTQPATMTVTLISTAAATPSSSPSPELTAALTPGSTAAQTPTLTITITSTPTAGSSPNPTVSLTAARTGTDTPAVSSATIQISETPTAAPTSSPSQGFEPKASLTGFPTATKADTPTVTSTAESHLVLNEILADPPPEAGDANLDGVVSSSEDEFLEFVNAGSSNLDLSGWSISDQVTDRYTFPAGMILEPGCSLVVFGGGNPQGDFGGSRVLTAGYLGLNNSGDRIEVRDQQDQLQLFVAYGPEGGRDQSLTRNPDLNGPFELHSEIPAGNQVLFSPGTRLDGSPFPDCSP